MNNEVKIEFRLSWLSILCLILQIVFLALQLSGVIYWAWICVFIPLIVLGGLFAVDIILLIIYIIIWRKKQ